MSLIASCALLSPFAGRNSAKLRRPRLWSTAGQETSHFSLHRDVPKWRSRPTADRSADLHRLRRSIPLRPASPEGCLSHRSDLYGHHFAFAFRHWVLHVTPRVRDRRRWLSPTDPRDAAERGRDARPKGRMRADGKAVLKGRSHLESLLNVLNARFARNLSPAASWANSRRF